MEVCLYNRVGFVTRVVMVQIQSESFEGALSDGMLKSQIVKNGPKIDFRYNNFHR